MTFKKLFKMVLDAAISGNAGGFDATQQLNQMAHEDHLRAHHQAVLDHNRHMDMHMMGPHF